jgi:hypothetical protein
MRASANRRLGYLLAWGLTTFVAAPANADDTLPVVSQEACRAQATHLMKVIEDRTRAGKHAVWDVNGFFFCLSPPGDILNLTDHLKLEDNNNPRPLRSGGEVAFYNRLKEEIAKLKPGEHIDQGKLLAWGLDAVAAPSGTANLQLALLTVHNVVRALARPQTWPAEPNPSDAAYPMFLDLWGQGSSGGKTLGEALKEPRKASGQFDDAAFTMRRFFDPKDGVFLPLPGTEKTEFNAGSHYYFWIGALAETSLGSVVTMGGMVGELRAKRAHDRGRQGEIEVTHFICGSIFGGEARKLQRTLLSSEGAPPGRCAARENGARLVLLGTEYEVKDNDTKQFVPGKSGKTPTSIWNVAGNAFQFKSQKDGFELRAEWSEMPAEMFAFKSHEFTVKLSIKNGTREAQLAFYPVGDVAFWQIGLNPSSVNSKTVGVNAHRIDLHGEQTAKEPAQNEGALRVSIAPVGKDAKVVNGAVVGGNGKVIAGRKPDKFDAYFLELNINTFAKVRWIYVPEGSPLLLEKKPE